MASTRFTTSVLAVSPEETYNVPHQVEIEIRRESYGFPDNSVLGQCEYGASVILIRWNGVPVPNVVKDEQGRVTGAHSHFSSWAEVADAGWITRVTPPEPEEEPIPEHIEKMVGTIKKLEADAEETAGYGFYGDAASYFDQASGLRATVEDLGFARVLPKSRFPSDEADD